VTSPLDAISNGEVVVGLVGLQLCATSDVEGMLFSVATSGNDLSARHCGNGTRFFARLRLSAPKVTVFTVTLETPSNCEGIESSGIDSSSKRVRDVVSKISLKFAWASTSTSSIDSSSSSGTNI